MESCLELNFSRKLFSLTSNFHVLVNLIPNQTKCSKTHWEWEWTEITVFPFGDFETWIGCEDTHSFYGVVNIMHAGPRRIERNCGYTHHVNPINRISWLRYQQYGPHQGITMTRGLHSVSFDELVSAQRGLGWSTIRESSSSTREAALYSLRQHLASYGSQAAIYCFWTLLRKDRLNLTAYGLPDLCEALWDPEICKFYTKENDAWL